MASIEIETESYRPLAAHLPQSKSFRDLARELGYSHDYWYRKCRRDSADLIDRVEQHMRAGRRPLFEVPYGQPLEDFAAALTLCQFATDALRARGWSVKARTVRYRDLDGVAFEIVHEEES